jgi:hypothetical protein
MGGKDRCKRAVCVATARQQIRNLCSGLYTTNSGLYRLGQIRNFPTTTTTDWGKTPWLPFSPQTSLLLQNNGYLGTNVQNAMCAIQIVHADSTVQDTYVHAFAQRRWVKSLDHIHTSVLGCELLIC